MTRLRTIRWTLGALPKSVVDAACPQELEVSCCCRQGVSRLCSAAVLGEGGAEPWCFAAHLAVLQSLRQAAQQAHEQVGGHRPGLDAGKPGPLHGRQHTSLIRAGV